MREKNRKPIANNRKRLPQFTTMNVIDGQAGLIICSSLIFYSLTIDNILNIIVLLILAGVSIATLTGENGILTRANDAKTETEEAKEDELRRLTALEAATNLEDTIYKDNSTGEEKTVTIPAETAISQVEGENTLKDGLVIIDKNGNEWVWIEVPKSIYENEEYYTNGATKPTSSEDYTNIEKIMQNYASKYRESGYSDDWYSEEQHGLTKKEYDDLKKNMLKSVYENGGFYIGKYEVGIEENTYRNYGEDYTTEHLIEETPVIRQDKYVYNWVRCSQAQELSEKLAIGGKTSSLMFGIQWDLVLAYLEANGVDETELKTNSSSLGNYYGVSFDITRGKYSIDNGASYIDVNGIYPKPASSVLLTSGATERSSKMNIYDLAGNIWEWTLEKSNDDDNPCINRGGGYSGYGSSDPVSDHSSRDDFFSSYLIGFRPTLY